MQKNAVKTTIIPIFKMGESQENLELTQDYIASKGHFSPNLFFILQYEYILHIVTVKIKWVNTYMALKTMGSNGYSISISSYQTLLFWGY